MKCAVELAILTGPISWTNLHETILLQVKVLESFVTDVCHKC